MLAHELRNPLQTAQIYLDFVEEGDEASTAQVREALERIDEIIEVLLVLARSQNQVGEREAVGLADVAAEAWAETETEGATLKVDTSQVVRVNPMHLQNLLENLFRNSVEHGDGDVTVRVGAHDSGFYVEDDGPGIPEADRESVVEAGYTTDAGGIGLGLTFVAQLVDAYGWEYAIAESDVGGARFEFTDVETLDG